MAPSEKVALGAALEALERPAAEARKADGQKIGSAVRDGDLEEKFSPRSKPGKVYDLVGEAVGMSGPIYKRAKAVVRLADEGDPAAIEAKADMDRTGKVQARRQLQDCNWLRSHSFPDWGMVALVRRGE